MKIEDCRQHSTVKTARDLPVGYYKGSIGPTYSGLFIRTYECVVKADSPNSTWTLDVPVKDWVRVHGVIRIERNA